MRVGSIVLFLNSVCVQSYRWEFQRPLGRLQPILEILDEYECDEVSIIRPVRGKETNENYLKDVSLLGDSKTSTPISFGGGIRTKSHIDALHSTPVERLIFTTCFIERNHDLLEYAISLFGKQAIQCLLPIHMGDDGVISIYRPENQDRIKMSSEDMEFIDKYANEIIVVDIRNEGEFDKFNWTILDILPFPMSKMVISGGVGLETIGKAKLMGLCSVLIDNKTLHKEYSIEEYKNV